MAFPLSPTFKAALARQAALKQELTIHHDLMNHLTKVQSAREAGNARMALPVDLGMEFYVEGVVEDTSRIYLSLGLQEIWLEMPVDAAQIFLNKRCSILESKLEAMADPIRKQKEDYTEVAKTLQKILSPNQAV